MEHPSLSRRHAIFLRNKVTNDIFLYDHGSTHGTTINFRPVKAFEFNELNDGDAIKFADSTRMVIVHIEDEELNDLDEEKEESEKADEQADIPVVSETKKEALSYQKKIQEAILQGQKHT